MNPKIQQILEEIAWGNFVGEDYSSRDYCKYCHRQYGNYNKFGYLERSIQENHEEDCIYRLANEVLEDMNTLNEGQQQG